MAEKNQELSLESIISAAIAVPGVKVNRTAFLTECFRYETGDLSRILERGPVEAGCSREQLSNLASKLVTRRTGSSSVASFFAGLPGGLAMSVSVPADVLQFFAVALRLAQELSYLYGGADLWKNGEVDTAQVTGRLTLYCGVMFGVSGAASGVRLMTAENRIPGKLLTKTFWYPVVKQIGSAVGAKAAKSTVAKSVAKLIPVVSGFVSGGINYVSMLPMGNRLAETLEDACFDYTEEQMRRDLAVVEAIGRESVPEESETATFLKGSVEGVAKGLKDIGYGVTGVLSKLGQNVDVIRLPKGIRREDVYKKIEKLAKLRDMGALTEEEFAAKKEDLLKEI